MPRVSGGAGRFRIPGVYEVLLDRLCVSGADPRLVLFSDGEVRGRRPVAERVAAFEERLAAGEPLEVSRWYFGGRSIPREDSWPAWLRDHFGGVKTIRVNADDTVEPAETQQTHLRRHAAGPA